MKAGLPAEEKQRLRQIVRHVHPDRFVAYPVERAHNSTSLQVSLKPILLSLNPNFILPFTGPLTVCTCNDCKAPGDCIYQ